MFSKFALLTSLLLASVALAVPSSLVEIPPAHRSEDHQTPPINHLTSRADAASELQFAPGKIWAGIVTKGVRTIPMIHDHVRSHYFADRQVFSVSLASSPSHP